MSKVFKSPMLSLENPYSISIPKNKKELHKRYERNPVIEDCEVNNVKYQAKKLLDEAYAKAQQILEQAEKERREILQKLQEEIKALKKQGYDEGFSIGKQEGFEKGLQEYKGHIKEAIELKKQFLLEKQRIVKLAEKDIVELSIKIVEKVLDEALTENRDYIINLISAGLNKCNEKEGIIIRVPQESYELVDSHRENILKSVEGISEVSIIGDITLKRGQCIIETPSEKINTSISQQLNFILNTLLGDKYDI
ncbi:MAG: hypothetical protein HPY70_03565 [Firmicutes bacterium]|nr:hypothetical protein [Bacillota bacterium]